MVERDGGGMSMTTQTVEVGRRAALSDPLTRLDRMIEIRAVEDSLQELYNGGHIRGSTHLSSGQEAVSVAIGASTNVDDVVTCTYRGHGTALALGLTPTSVIGEITGRVTGCAGGLGGSMHLTGPHVGLWPTFAIVGAGLPVAVGAAVAFQTRGEPNVAVAVCGDGATNIGAFHESLNLAAIWKLPIVFVVENNLYGEYTRIQLSTPIEHLADRASSYGMPGVAFDGQDLTRAVDAMQAAVDRARAGQGPSLLEAKTYRYSGHSRADAASYRPDGELETWLVRDPIGLYAQHLTSSGQADEAVVAGRQEAVRADVAAAVEQALTEPTPELHEMFRHVLREPGHA